MRVHITSLAKKLTKRKTQYVAKFQTKMLWVPAGKKTLKEKQNNLATERGLYYKNVATFAVNEMFVCLEVDKIDVVVAYL